VPLSSLPAIQVALSCRISSYSWFEALQTRPFGLRIKHESESQQAAIVSALVRGYSRISLAYCVYAPEGDCLDASILTVESPTKIRDGILSSVIRYASVNFEEMIG
jgi:hypothetical protein